MGETRETVTTDEWIKILEDSGVARSNMNKLVMNYLVTGTFLYVCLCSNNFPYLSSVFLLPINILCIAEGFKEAAEKFQQESGIAPSVNLHSLDDRMRIRDAIMNGRIEEATTLINQLHAELLDNDRHLYFHLQVCN